MTECELIYLAEIKPLDFFYDKSNKMHYFSNVLRIYS